MTTGRLKRAVKRQVLPFYGKKGAGWIKNPKKALYNAVYHRVTIKSPLPYLGSDNKKVTRRSNMAFSTYIETADNDNVAESIATSYKALTVGSGNFEQLKQDLTEVYDNRLKLKKELSKSKIIYYLTYLFNSKDKRQAKKDIIEKLSNAVEHAYIDLNFEVKLKDAHLWMECCETFEEVMKSDKIWDLTSRKDTNRYRERTIASESVDRKIVVARDHKSLEFIKSDVDNIYIPNVNGPDIYIFPAFIVLFKNYKQFSIHDIQQVNISVTATGFHEEDGVSGDATVVGQTYKYTNKNGTPDKRFANNYTIPVVRYGDLRLDSDGGINDRYLFSNFDKFTEFSKALTKFVQVNLKVSVQK